MATNPQKKYLTFSIIDFYKHYSKQCNKTKRFPKREYKKYRDFMRDVLAEIFHKIVYDSWHFVMPYSLGTFFLKHDKKVTGKRVPTGYRDGKTTYTFNDHTLRNTYKFKWDKGYCNFENSKYYTFVTISGREKLHRKYKVGKLALSNFYFKIGKDPKYKLPIKYYKGKTKIEELPKDEQ